MRYQWIGSVVLILLAGCSSEETDPCAIMLCDTPPSPSCANASTLIRYSATGTCTAGKCAYGSKEQTCANGCASGVCKSDPCIGVFCTTPPDDACVDATYLRQYQALGTCSGGDCDYTYEDVECGQGCDTANDVCFGCTPRWQDSSSCGCTPTACADCSGTKDQEDGCGHTRTVACVISATGCAGDCCNGTCCGTDQVCHGGGCCTPDCTNAVCGSDGCGDVCGQCQSPRVCDNGACVNPTCLGCTAGEVCVDSICAPVAILLASPSNKPSLWCPPGYQEAGHWRPGPGAYDSAMEGVDFHEYRIDAGWMWICSADPTQVRAVVTADDCGTSVGSCPDQRRGSWHVGSNCGSATVNGVDEAGVSIQVGWMDLCVASGVEAKVETGHNDCGADGPGCGNQRLAGSWHTNPVSCGTGNTAIGDSGTAIEAGWLQFCVDSDGYPPTDTTTLDRHVVTGYQGWFGAPNDGSQSNAWRHWFRSQTPTANNATFDLWPDLSELDPDELFDTSMTFAGGGTVRLYSAYKEKTVQRHMKWMAQYGIDSAFLQRFLNEVRNPTGSGRAFRDQVTRNVMSGAERYGRSFVIMYDISGANEPTYVQDLITDWKHLVDDLQVTGSPRYQQHDGKPLVAIWGQGFNDRPGSVADAQALFDFFRSDPQQKYHATVMGGVPTHWRTGTNDSKPGFGAIYRSFDIISPWSVGRFGDNAGVDNFNTSQIQPDLIEAAANSADYLPVVWPGFSWANLQQDTNLFNAIPRNGGAFYWKQISAALDSGTTMLYIAMFDEVDESTAIYKAATSQAQVPAQGQFLTLDADGTQVPSDWYLRLSGAALKTTVGQIPWSADVPLK